jgi:DNA-binding protein H-NS
MSNSADAPLRFYLFAACDSQNPVPANLHRQVPSFQHVCASRCGLQTNYSAARLLRSSTPRLLRMMLAFGIKSFLGAIMKRNDLEILPSDELWVLHQKIMATLKAKISAEKKVLEDRLSQLNGRFRAKQTSETPERRSYPTVFPKFRNPEQPSETWAGRGKKPRWLTAQLKSGKQIDDFRIDLAAA